MKFKFVVSAALLCAFCLNETRALPFKIPDFGRWIFPTLGEIWPKPQSQVSQSTFFVLRPDNFQFLITGQRCDILDEAVRRYYQLIFYPGGSARRAPFSRSPPEPFEQNANFRAFLNYVNVNLLNPCESLPSADMNESYDIKIDTPDNPLEASITSTSVWGILRGLESFSQLVYASPETGVAYQVNGTAINDFPRFGYRGFMLDAARHFMPLKTIKKMLDLMAQNKMNVLHWHFTDDASFPYESYRFPELSRLGAFQPFTHVYTQSDVREIIEYARLRGIRVIPEFDSPDHTHSWGPGQPGLLTECYDDSGNLLVPDEYGAINPVKEENYVFLQEFFSEIFNLFPDPYVHLGGDEVSYYCWRRHPDIKAFMASQGWGDRYELLEDYYMDRLMEKTAQVTQDQMRYIVWQEPIDHNATLRPDTVVMVWKGERENLTFTDEIARISKFGHKMIVSAPWYLNYISYGLDWEKYYLAEPLDFDGTPEEKALVIGGQVCMWSEYLDSVSLIPRTWPRASTVAERLWSDKSVTDTYSAALRLEEHRCRMLRRGFNVDPSNGVNFCDVEWDQ